MAYKENSTRPWPMLPMLLVLLALAATAEAQPTGPIGLNADSSTYDADREAVHLQGNIRITRGPMEVTADEGFAYRGDNGYERVELFGDPVEWRTVTEEGGETTGHADQVVYNLLERIVILEGEAYIEESRGTYSGGRLVYNLDTQGVQGEGGVRLSIEPEVIDGPQESAGDDDNNPQSGDGESD